MFLEWRWRVGQSNELTLVAQVLEGNAEAFEALVRPHMGLFLAGIRKILRDSDDAQDVLQEALLTIHRELRRFLGLSRFSTWAYRICINESLMSLRKRTRQREDVLEESSLALGFMDLSLERNLMLKSEADHFWKVLGEGLACLSQTQRAVFILRDVLEVETEEAAQRLGISRSMVRQRLHRARIVLRHLLGPDPTRHMASA
jgi:RNA polymerase sigma-70 factor (ECF subfamily)